MYDFGRKVYVKSVGRVGTIQERYYTGGNCTGRHAAYIVRILGTKNPPLDYGTSTDDLIAADYCCDGCGNWRAGQPHRHSVVRLGDGSIDDTFKFCFLCSAEQIHGSPY